MPKHPGYKSAKERIERAAKQGTIDIHSASILILDLISRVEYLEGQVKDLEKQISYMKEDLSDQLIDRID